MRRWTAIGSVALLCACSGPKSSQVNGGVGSSSAQPAPPSTNAATTTTDTNVTLIGCLQGSPLAEGSDTAASRASRGAPAGVESTGPESGRFRLVDAVSADPDASARGANGAGASGGPLVSGTSTFVLDGVTAAASTSVNKRVRVTGRIDARDTSGVAATPGEPTGTAGTGGPTAGASSGTAGSGIGSATSSRGAGTATSSAERHLNVASIDVVAPNCSR